MEVECNITNASTPTSTNGVAQVQVFGGTSPYIITWSNGQVGNTITNLSPGTYSATVVDYFGDYSVTTACVVGSASEVVYQFDSCPGFAAQTIYVSGSTYDPPFPNFKPIIRFNEISNCYEFVGPISTSGLTYSALTVSNSYVNCSSCNPPTPTPSPQDTLCLNGLNSNPALSQQYEFTANGTDINGNYQWIDTVNSLTMSYNVNTLYWEVLTWTSISGNIGVMRLSQSPVLSQPIGTWINQGGNPKYTWNVSVGPCTSPALSLNITAIDPQCQGTNGSSIMIGSNGVPPYTYTIVGTTSPQSSGTFTNIIPGSYVGSITDSDTPQNTSNSNFTIGNGQASTTYSLLMTKSNEVITNPVGSQQTVTYDYSLAVTPSLPSGLSLSFDIDFSHTETEENVLNHSGLIQFTNSITGILDGSPMTFTSSNPLTLNGSPSSNCQNETVEITTYTTTNQTSIIFTNSTTITGTVTVNTDLSFYPVGQCDCPIQATNKVSVQATNVRVVGNNCDSVNNNTNTIQGQSFQSGCFAQV